MEKREQEILRVAELLTSKKGYLKDNKLKASYTYLEWRFNTDKDTIKEAVKLIKKGKTFSNYLDHEEIPKGASIKMSSVNSVYVNVPGTYFVTGCAHAPFHNKKMYESIYSYISKENIKLQGVILDGDILDMNSLSSHDRGKVAIPGVTLDWEYSEATKFMNEIDDLGGKNKVFIFGNHEDRYFRALSDVDVSKYGSALKSPIEALKLNERGYEIIEDWKSGHVMLGSHLEINHGEFCNVHTAKKTIDTYRKSVLYFHTHRFQIYTEGLVGGWNMGWGGDVNAPVFNYASRAMKKSWFNAAALVTIDEYQYYHIQPLLFIGNKLIVNGNCY